MSPEETTAMLAERCHDIATSGWRDYVPASDGDDPEDEPLAVINLVGQDGNYYGNILVIASGGPHIEINTRDAAVYGRWANSEAKANLSIPATTSWLPTGQPSTRTPTPDAVPHRRTPAHEPRPQPPAPS